MSTVQEIESAIPRLSRQEIGELKASLEQARSEIAAGQFRTRQPQ
jgi:hypothetical protein